MYNSVFSKKTKQNTTVKRKVLAAHTSAQVNICHVDELFLKPFLICSCILLEEMEGREGHNDYYLFSSNLSWAWLNESVLYNPHCNKLRIDCPFLLFKAVKQMLHQHR